MRTGFLALILVALTALGAAAQPTSSDLVEGIDEAYRQLDFEAAERLATEALANYTEYSLDQLTRVHTYLALIAYNRGNLERARGQFLAALQLTPDLQMDPALVPPKIQAFLEDIRSGLVSDADAMSEASVRYLLLRDPRVDGALRSMILPGWGQIYKGHAAKGYGFAGLFAATGAVSIYAHIRTNDARKEYEEALRGRGADERYDTYRRWKRARNGLALTAGLVWAASYVDALLTRPARVREGSLSLQAAPTQISLRVRY